MEKGDIFIMTDIMKVILKTVNIMGKENINLLMALIFKVIGNKENLMEKDVFQMLFQAFIQAILNKENDMEGGRMFGLMDNVTPEIGLMIKCMVSVVGDLHKLILIVMSVNFFRIKNMDKEIINALMETFSKVYGQMMLSKLFFKLELKMRKSKTQK